MSGTRLFWANLSDADLSDADLSGAEVVGLEFSIVKLMKPNLNLKDPYVIVIEELEKQAKSLKGATMPDGTKHP